MKIKILELSLALLFVYVNAAVNTGFADNLLLGEELPIRQGVEPLFHLSENVTSIRLLVADNGIRRRPGQETSAETLEKEREEDTYGPRVIYKNPNRGAANIDKKAAIPSINIQIPAPKFAETLKEEINGTEKSTPAPKGKDAKQKTSVTKNAPGNNPKGSTRIEPVPDRWRLSKDFVGENLGVVKESLTDPYHRNILKADRPFCCEDWFFSASVISDTVIEPRSFPVPVAAVGTDAGQLDVLGSQYFTVFSQSLIFPFVLYKGDTVFRPPDYEFRFTPVLNYNRVTADESRLLFVDPSKGETRTDEFFAVQELFVDKHLRNVSERFDFDSIRVGLQPFSTDFRGFLFQDIQLGVRLFGNRNNNIFQYNLAAFRRVEKDTNSGLNDVGQSLRKDDIYIANLYWQDMPSKGFTSQVTAVHNRNRERSQGQHVDENGFVVRPAPVGTQRLRDYDVTYLGYNGDGHFGRLNLTTSLYYAFGDESTGAFIDKPSDISAFFAAAEVSVDYDWMRFRGSFLYGSGDDDPFDDESNGFDAIFENPVFAGADTSFWIRQTVPLIGGGGSQISGRNGILNSLRSSKEEGQSNFTNPGITLFGVSADFDITPELRISTNVNKLYFNETETLKVLRNQGNIDRDIGLDVSVSAIYRPFFSQNAVFRLSGAALYPGQGFKDLFGDETAYSILANFTLTY